MLRCNESAGRFRVTFLALHEEDPYHQQIIGHRDVYLPNVDGSFKLIEAAPIAKTEEPFEGELCVHELAWMNGLPGKDYPRNFKFTIEKLK